MKANYLKKTYYFYRKNGFIKTIQRIISYCKIISNRKHQEYIISENKDNETFWMPLVEVLEKNEKEVEFVDIFHVLMGWETPLFQRFQHISLQAGHIVGISFYGAHPTVDKDVHTFKKINDKLYLVNFENYDVKTKFFEIMDKYNKVKVIRLQSIDLATTIEELESFILRGYKILYEYIDELTPQITGDIPDFVWKRHEYVLRNEEIYVIATSDKLYSQVLKYRSKNCILSCNGVDYEHWNLNNKNIVPPKDIQEIVDSNKIIIGYHGALAKWIDYDLIKKIADDGRFIVLLIGYEHDLSFANSGLKTHKNIRYIGHKNYNILNYYSHFYDIAIIPFKVNDITQSVSPVKLFEYMAAGKPIVTYDLHECRKYNSCIISKDMNDFIKNINIALEMRNNKEYLETLKREASQNTWRQKALEMKELFLSN